MPDPTPAPLPAATPATPAITPAPAPIEPAAPAPSPAPAAAAPTWGENWRQDVAADDKVRARLDRYASPKDVVNALIAAQNKISSGELKKPLGENATTEEVTQWRKDNGIPEKPEAYLDNLPQGLVIGENDKELFGSFAAELHKINAEPKVAHAAIGWYNQFQEQEQAKRLEADTQAKQVLEDKLRTDWGADYRANINSVAAVLSSAPEGVDEAIGSARMPDGSRIIDQPAVVSWLATMAREINPVATLVPGSSGNQMQSLEGEISAIETRMRTDRKSYMKDEAAQERYRQLVDARDKMKARTAA